MTESMFFYYESWFKTLKSCWYRRDHGFKKGIALRPVLGLNPSSVIPSCVILGYKFSKHQCPHLSGWPKGFLIGLLCRLSGKDVQSACHPRDLSKWERLSLSVFSFLHPPPLLPSSSAWGCLTLIRTVTSLSLALRFIVSLGKPAKKQQQSFLVCVPAFCTISLPLQARRAIFLRFCSLDMTVTVVVYGARVVLLQSQGSCKGSHCAPGLVTRIKALVLVGVHWLWKELLFPQITSFPRGIFL